jgi:hypothetical protein
MPEETEAIIPYADSIGEAVLAVELWSRAVHSQQRLAVLDKLSVPDRVGQLMRDVNRWLSAPDEPRATMRQANDLVTAP